MFWAAHWMLVVLATTLAAAASTLSAAESGTASPPPRTLRRDAPNRPATTQGQPPTSSWAQPPRDPPTVPGGSGVSRPLSISPPSQSRRLGPKSEAGQAGPPVVTAIGSLVLVVGLLLVCLWVARRTSRSTVMTLPEGVVEVLGRSRLPGRQQLYLVRLGNKLLLLCVTGTGTESVAEITDPAEVDRIAGICRQSLPGSVAASFRQVLSQLSHSSPDDGIKRRVARGHLPASTVEA